MILHVDRRPYVLDGPMMKHLSLVFLVVLLTARMAHLQEGVEDSDSDKQEEAEVPEDDILAATSLLDITKSIRCPDATCSEADKLDCFNFCGDESIEYYYEVNDNQYDVKCCMSDCGQCLKKWVYTDDDGNKQYVTNENYLTPVQYEDDNENEDDNEEDK